MAEKLGLLKIKPKAKTKKEFSVFVDERKDVFIPTEREQDRHRYSYDEDVQKETRGKTQNIPKAKQEPKTTIIDKRSTANINRDDFLKKLKASRQRPRRQPKQLIEEREVDVDDVEDAEDAEAVLERERLRRISQEREKDKPKKIRKIKIKKRTDVPPDGLEMVDVPEMVDADADANVDVVRKKIRIVRKKVADADVDVAADGATAKAKKPKKIAIRRKKVKISGDLVISYFNEKNLPKKGKKVLLKTSEYYLSNRQIFIDFINNLFSYYGETTKKGDEITCAKLDEAKDSTTFKLLNHQLLVRDYINMHTPYRGILLFHGLGSGKTCSSIAIAEGMKDDKEVIVMTPASLRRNYIEELKSCGDPLIRRNSHWVFLLFSDDDIRRYSEGGSDDKIHHYSEMLSISSDFLFKQGGVWLVNSTKSPNYESLNKEQRTSLEGQIDAMISNKYTFINYNGLRASHLKKLTEDGTINPFDGKVIIVDEVHNLVSRIVNKMKKPESLNMQLYHLLCSAENCRMVFLSGTPIINYPNELGILFNMLRGYIKTFQMTLDIKTRAKVSDETLRKTLIGNRNLGTLVDFVEYKPSSKTLVLSRNPFGFINSFNRAHEVKGVAVDEKGQVDDASLITLLEDTLVKNKMKIIKGSIKVDLEKSIPDDLDTFNRYFINETTGVMENRELFKRFVMGLVSYYRSANEELMPAYDPDRDFIIEKLEMTDHQFNIYEEARKEEREADRKKKQRAAKNKAGKENLYEPTSTYRIFSRLACNFVFPESLKRPKPRGDDTADTIAEDESAINEDRVDGKTNQEIMEKEEGDFTPDDEPELLREEAKLNIGDYDSRIKEVLRTLDSRKDEILSKESLGKYSPKFLKIIENIEDEDNVGSHLIYSQFRTLEGIGILKLALEANGFEQFKITKNDVGNVVLDIPMERIDRPRFVLYTGTEDVETKEIYRNVFNGNWKQLPTSLSQQLRELGTNNLLGDIIRIFMITSSGAEGISLKGCRHVHIVEPYWHPVRIHQVIGRIRRICSHAELPEELQNIKVFMYLMTLSEKQRAGEESLELRRHDVSYVDKKTPLTTDEYLFEVSNIKEEINTQLERAMKEASIDCMVYVKQNAKEGLSCLSFGPVRDANKLSRRRTVEDDDVDTVQELNKTVITMKAVEITLAGKKYAFVKSEDANVDIEERPDLVGFVYDYQSFLDARENTAIKPRLVGEMVKDEGGKGYIFNAI